MKKIVVAVAAIATLVTSSVVPAVSAPWRPAGLGNTGSNVEQVRYRRGYYNRGGTYYYNGYRGYNNYRPGYRRYNNQYFAPGAFAAGAIIGGAIGAIASQPTQRTYVAPSGGGHVQWCYSQYRSYRASDNTFQPYNGPRQQCVSPY